jgi:hypothetical protein
MTPESRNHGKAQVNGDSRVQSTCNSRGEQEAVTVTHGTVNGHVRRHNSLVTKRIRPYSWSPFTCRHTAPIIAQVFFRFRFYFK